MRDFQTIFWDSPLLKFAVVYHADHDLGRFFYNQGVQHDRYPLSQAKARNYLLWLHISRCFYIVNPRISILHDHFVF